MSWPRPPDASSELAAQATVDCQPCGCLVQLRPCISLLHRYQMMQLGMFSIMIQAALSRVSTRRSGCIGRLAVLVQQQLQAAFMRQHIQRQPHCFELAQTCIASMHVANALSSCTSIFNSGEHETSWHQPHAANAYNLIGRKMTFPQAFALRADDDTSKKGAMCVAKLSISIKTCGTCADVAIRKCARYVVHTALKYLPTSDIEIGTDKAAAHKVSQHDMCTKQRTSCQSGHGPEVARCIQPRQAGSGHVHQCDGAMLACSSIIAQMCSQHQLNNNLQQFECHDASLQAHMWQAASCTERPADQFWQPSACNSIAALSKAQSIT